jgi:serine/threonine protein kinase
MVKKPRFGHYVVDDTSIYGIDRHSGYRAGVYEATDPAGRIVRLELLPYGSISTGKLREFVERLNAVAKHSRIVEIGTEGNQLFMVRQYFRGISLSDLLRQRRMPPEQAVKIIESIADTVDSAHQHGLILAGISTQAIFLGDDRSVYLLPNPDASFPSPTDANVPFDDLLERDVAANTDVYMLAVVLYEMLAGTSPFRRAGPSIVLRRGLGWQLDPETALPAPVSLINPDIPKAMDEVLARGLATNPAFRYPSAKAFAVAARRALETEISPEPRIPSQLSSQPSVNPMVLWIMRHLPRHFQGKSWRSRSASIELRVNELKARIRAGGASEEDPLNGLTDLLQRRHMGLALLSARVQVRGRDDGET